MIDKALTNIQVVDQIFTTYGKHIKIRVEQFHARHFLAKTSPYGTANNVGCGVGGIGVGWGNVGYRVRILGYRG